MSVRIFMIRHGQTTSNVRHALDTELPGADLTELGVQQATEAGQALAAAGARRIILGSSPAARAIQTADHLGASFTAAEGEILGRAEVPNLQEIPAGEMEMRDDKPSHAEYHTTFGAWLMGDLDRPVRGALNGNQMLGRYLPNFLDYVASAPEDSDVAVVSHGAAIRFISAYLGGVNSDFAFSNYLANTQWVELNADSLGRVSDLAEKARRGEIASLRDSLSVVQWAGVDCAGLDCAGLEAVRES